MLLYETLVGSTVEFNSAWLKKLMGGFSLSYGVVIVIFSDSGSKGIKCSGFK